MGIIIKEEDRGGGKEINLFCIDNIKIIDYSSGIYTCDIFIRTWSFRVELFNVSITEIEFIKIKNGLTALLRKEILSFEFEPMEPLFKIRVERNHDFAGIFKLFINAQDLYYGTMNIETAIECDSLTELIKQLENNIEPIHKGLWSMSNQAIKDYLITKWSDEGFIKLGEE